jgi:hypothetical protein
MLITMFGKDVERFAIQCSRIGIFTISKNGTCVHASLQLKLGPLQVAFLSVA